MNDEQWLDHHLTDQVVPVLACTSVICVENCYHGQVRSEAPGSIRKMLCSRQSLLLEPGVKVRNGKSKNEVSLHFFCRRGEKGEGVGTKFH